MGNCFSCAASGPVGYLAAARVHSQFPLPLVDKERIHQLCGCVLTFEQDAYDAVAVSSSALKATESVSQASYESFIQNLVQTSAEVQQELSQLFKSLAQQTAQPATAFFIRDQQGNYHVVRLAPCMWRPSPDDTPLRAVILEHLRHAGHNPSQSQGLTFNSSPGHAGTDSSVQPLSAEPIAATPSLPHLGDATPATATCAEQHLVLGAAEVTTIMMAICTKDGGKVLYQNPASEAYAGRLTRDFQGDRGYLNQLLALQPPQTMDRLLEAVITDGVWTQVVEVPPTLNPACPSPAATSLSPTSPTASPDMCDFKHQSTLDVIPAQVLLAARCSPVQARQANSPPSTPPAFTNHLRLSPSTPTQGFSRPSTWDLDRSPLSELCSKAGGGGGGGSGGGLPTAKVFGGGSRQSVSFNFLDTQGEKLEEAWGFAATKSKDSSRLHASTSSSARAPKVPIQKSFSTIGLDTLDMCQGALDTQKQRALDAANSSSTAAAEPPTRLRRSLRRCLTSVGQMSLTGGGSMTPASDSISGTIRAKQRRGSTIINDLRAFAVENNASVASSTRQRLLSLLHAAGSSNASSEHLSTGTTNSGDSVPSSPGLAQARSRSDATPGQTPPSRLSVPIKSQLLDTGLTETSTSLDEPQAAGQGQTALGTAASAVGPAPAATAGPVKCWHEVTVQIFLHPSTGEQALLVSHTDVTDRVEMEAKVIQLTEAQLYMLENMFPRHILERIARVATATTSPGAGSALSQGPDMLALTKELSQQVNKHDCVTIMFTDIVGFTSMSKEVEAEQVMHFLNELFAKFDELAVKHKVSKVETAGDCYIVCAGLLEEDEEGFKTVATTTKGTARTRAARKVLNFAVEMMQVARTVMMPHDGQPVQQRVGIHSGAVVSGLIGQLLPKFSLFGDTMNTASRMESTSIPGRIQVSEVTYELLQDKEPRWECTGGIQVKGKGLMNTYLLAASAYDTPAPLLDSTVSSLAISPARAQGDEGFLASFMTTLLADRVSEQHWTSSATGVSLSVSKGSGHHLATTPKVGPQMDTVQRMYSSMTPGMTWYKNPLDSGSVLDSFSGPLRALKLASYSSTSPRPKSCPMHLLGPVPEGDGYSHVESTEDNAGSKVLKTLVSESMASTGPASSDAPTWPVLSSRDARSHSNSSAQAVHAAISQLPRREHKLAPLEDLLNSSLAGEDTVPVGQDVLNSGASLLSTCA